MRFGEGAGKLQALGTVEMEAGAGIGIAYHQIAVADKGVAAQLVGYLQADVVNTGGGGYDIGGLAFNHQRTAAVLEFPIPGKGTVAAGIDEL